MTISVILVWITEAILNLWFCEADVRNKVVLLGEFRCLWITAVGCWCWLVPAELQPHGGVVGPQPWGAANSMRILASTFSVAARG